MPDNKVYQKLKIFLASPGDVADERERVKAVVEELTRTGNAADKLGIELEVLDWKTHVSPAVGRPEGETLKQLPVEMWDIFIGIFWMRFGTPPNAVHSQTGQPLESGTEEEFIEAYGRQQREGLPKVLLYRCDRPPKRLQDLKSAQYQNVEKFFAQCEPGGKHQLVYRLYESPEQFERFVREDLSKLLEQFKTDVPLAAPTPAAPRESVAVLQRRYLDKLQIDCNLLPLVAIAKESDPHASLRLTLDKVYIGLNTTLQVDKAGKPLLREAMADREAREETRLLTAWEAAARETPLVILGDPGSGKSSFINYLLWQLAERQLRPNAEPLAGWPHPDCFPVRILLRKLLVTVQQAGSIPKNQTERQRYFQRLVLQHLQDMLANDGLADFAPALEGLIADGRCLIVFDGLDEAPPNQRGLLRNALEYFCAGAPRNRFLITCRILSYQKDAVLAGVNSVTLAPFLAEQTNDFIARWYGALQLLGKPETWAAAKTADLQEAVQRLPESLVRNPLLLTTLASLHANNVEMPRQRVKLYQKASELLLRRWQEEKTNDKISLFDELGLKDDLEIYHALWELGYFAQNQERGSAAADIPENEALLILKKRFSQLENPWGAAEKFLKFVDQSAGLLLGRGGAAGNVYAFPHRTFQEYFAGCYFAKLVDDFEELLQEKLLPEGDYWRLTAQLAVEEILHNDRREKAAIKVAYALCPVSEPELEIAAAWRGALWAANLALEIGLGRIAEDKRKEGGEAFLNRLRQRLVTILEKGLLPARERADAGFVLGQLGDPREGVCALPPIWVELPGGTFWMGSDDGEDREKPPHEVEVSPFKISKYPITNAQFEMFMNDGGYKNENWWSKEGWEFRQKENWEQPRWWHDAENNLPNQPVVGVSWFEAEAFCAWLTAKSKEQKENGGSTELAEVKLIVRLPTEAEWEFAARGKEGRKFPWSKDKDEPTPEHANYIESQIGRPTAVGTYRLGATPEGIFDLAGNVWEWCLDFYDENYYAECEEKGVVKDPLCTKESWGRVLRGASWYNGSGVLRGSRRDWNYPRDWSVYIGFRVCVGGES